MKDAKIWLKSALATLAIAMLLTAAHAQTETTLYSFNASGDPATGWSPYGGVIFDSAGNLYGTTVVGGNLNDCNGSGCGTVFQLTPDGTYNVLHTFAGYPSDGSNPYDGLVQDAKGNLYGTTHLGGANGPNIGFGAVFKLAPDGTETVLHSFTGEDDGCYPIGGLILEKGNLYGTTNSSGCGYGTVFEINAKTGAFSTLYTFCSVHDCADGAAPYGSLVYKDGNLYGTTEGGGANGVGTLFELAADGTETVLHSFAGGADGATPFGGPVFGKGGNLYGTTYAGGDAENCAPDGCGVVYEVTLKGVETVLFAFDGHIDPNSGDGDSCQGGLVADKKGNLYGFAEYGGPYNWGTVYELSPGKKNSWTFTLLHAFDPAAFQGDTDGAAPLYGSLVFDAKGNLYGTTIGGGAFNYGTVYEITP